MTEAASERLRFTGVEGVDFYNPSGTFAAKVGGKSEDVVAVRTESRDSEHSTVYFFAKSADGSWARIPAVKPIRDLQDPFYFELGPKLYLGGVRVVWDAAGTKVTSYYTEFFEIEGRDLSKIKSAGRGPDGMKDIRMSLAKDGRVLVLTRPQSGDPATGGRGKVGVLVVEDFASVTPEKVASAPIIQNLWHSNEQWGGANKILQISERGEALVLGHVAYFGEKQPGAKETDRNYYPILFIVDINSGALVPFKTAPGEESSFVVLTRRGQLERLTDAKRDDLSNVMFSSDLKSSGNGTVTLMAGIGDAFVMQTTAKMDPTLVALNPVLKEFIEHGPK